MRRVVLLFINGDRHEIAGDAAFSPLTDYLRYQNRLTGTKVVCAEGDCGACTVLVAKVDHAGMVSDFVPVNACITTPALLDGAHIVTVEGLACVAELHPVQEVMTQNHGTQCGFCTPGFVVSLAALFERKSYVTPKQASNALTGNLCRCTGYEPILKAANAIDEDLTGILRARYLSDAEVNRELCARAHDDLILEIPGASYFAPATLQALLEYKRDHPDARLIAAATDIGVQANKRVGWRQKFCSANRIAACREIRDEADALVVGVGVTLARLQEVVKDSHSDFHSLLNVFASPQIKNVATLVGNIANASPIADCLPFLFVMDAELRIANHRGSRDIKVGHFYRGYKQIDVQPDEVIVAVKIPKLVSGDVLKLYKVSRRRDLDISCVTAAYLLRCSGDKITESRVAYGGVGPTVSRLPQAEAILDGQNISRSLFEQAGHVAASEVNPIDDVRGGREYRLKLVKNLMVKFHHEEFSRTKYSP